MQLTGLGWGFIFGFFALVLGISMVTTTFPTDTPNLVTGIVRKNGVAGSWVWRAFLLTGMLMVFVYSKLWRRSEVLRDVEFFVVNSAKIGSLSALFENPNVAGKLSFSPADISGGWRLYRRKNEPVCSLWVAPQALDDRCENRGDYIAGTQRAGGRQIPFRIIPEVRDKER